MTRVTQRSASVFARRGPSRVAKRNSRKHKVILESVTQARKRLRSVISFEAKAPPGYTFIPAGNPHFTTACKELCRNDGMKVYAVSTTPHLHTHGLSQHVHRIGYHFPSAIVAAVCMDRGLYLTSTGKTVPFYSIGNETGPTQTNSASQITINTEARDVLKDLFPNIPDNDLNQIIKTAFQKGQRKVGTAVELPLARRAQLAVVAHIRHIYTNYDRLLKTTSFHEARASVEQPTLAKLVEWRGDDENGKTILEDVFREVIVISDDDDSDIEGETQLSHCRDTSVEVISSNPVVSELQMRPSNHSSDVPRGTQMESLEDDAPPGFQFIREASKRNKIDRRGFSRYQAWDRAINRYKNFTEKPSQQASPYHTGESFQENRGFDRNPALRRPPGIRHPSAAPFVISNHGAVTNNLSRPEFEPVTEHRVYPPADLLNNPGDAPVPICPPGSVSQERAPICDTVRPSLQQSDLSNRPVFVSGPKDGHERNDERYPPGPPGHLHSRNVSQLGHVLPSIEGPLSVQINRPSSGHIEHITKRMSGAFNFRSVTPHRQTHQGLPTYPITQDPAQEQSSKRRRVEYYEPVPLEKPLTIGTPPILGAYAGDRYAATTQSVHGGTLTRRRYVDSAESPRIADHLSGNAQDSPLSFTHFNREPRILVPQGPTKDYDTQPSFSSRPIDPHATHHLSPGQPQLYVNPDTRFGPSVTTGRDRTFQPRTLDVPEPRAFQSVHDHTLSGNRAPEIAPPQDAPFCWGKDTHGSYKPIEYPKTYANGFVRPIDNRILENPPQSNKFRSQGGQNRFVPSDSYAPIPLHGRALHESHVPGPSQQSPATATQGSRYHDNRHYITPPPVYHQKRHSQNSSIFSRYDHIGPIGLGTQAIFLFRFLFDSATQGI
ncbi:hypothetical protein BJX64DRAFT_264036 [Aspergillus heterothallicus]